MANNCARMFMSNDALELDVPQSKANTLSQQFSGVRRLNDVQLMETDYSFVTTRITELQVAA